MSLYISILFASGILLLGIMIVSQGHNQSAYGVNATEFLLYSSGYLNESMEFSMSTNGPSITGDYSNAPFGVDRITFPDGWSGQVKVPDARGLLTITAGPMTMNSEVSNNQMMQFYNKSKFIPNIAPTASMTDLGGSSMQADSNFEQPQISDNGTTIGQSTEIQTTTTNDTNTNIQNTAMDISLAVSSDPAFRGQDLVVYVNVVDSSKVGLTNAKVDGVIVDGPAGEQIIKNANSTQPIDISSLEGQKFSGVTDMGQFNQLTKLSGDFTNEKFAVVVTASADGYQPSSKIAVFTTG